MKVIIEPAPQMPLGVSEGAATSACVAPSSEEVKRIVGDIFEASMSYQSGEIGTITLRQRNAIHAVVWDSVNAVLAAGVPDDRIAPLEQQNAELVAALELCKKHMVGDKWDSLFIDGGLSKVKQP